MADGLDENWVVESVDQAISDPDAASNIRKKNTSNRKKSFGNQSKKINGDSSNSNRKKGCHSTPADARICGNSTAVAMVATSHSCHSRSTIGHRGLDKKNQNRKLEGSPRITNKHGKHSVNGLEKHISKTKWSKSRKISRFEQKDTSDCRQVTPDSTRKLKRNVKSRKKKPKMKFSNELVSKQNNPSEVLSFLVESVGPLLELDEDDFQTIRKNKDESLDVCLSRAMSTETVDPKFVASPSIIILSCSALRCLELKKALSKIAKCKCMKLFGKHLKVDEQVKQLQSDKWPVVVGTPHRVSTLIQHGALSLSCVRHVVLDWTWEDIKRRRMADMPGVREHLSSLLCRYLVPITRQNSPPVRWAVL